MLSNDLTDWLLDSDIPSIRCYTLVDLLGRSQDDADVVTAREELMVTGPIPAIFARQNDRGDWGPGQNYYSPKYRSTHWTMLLLEELGVDGRDDRFQRGADYMLSAVEERMTRRAERNEYGWSCLFANVLRYAARAGYVEDPRLQAILRYVEIDLGQSLSTCAYNGGWRCGWGVARSLWGAAAVPPESRSPALSAAIERGVGFLLDEFSLVEANYPTDEGKVHPLWFRLNFPLFYQSDILFALRTLAELDALRRTGTGPALDWLEGKRRNDGRWSGSNPFRKRTWSMLGDRADTDRWVSLQSATLLAAAGRLN